MRNHGRGLDLDFGLRLHQRHDLHDTHGREMLSHHPAVCRPNLRQLRVGFVPTRDVPREPHDMLRPPIRLRQYRENVLKRLAHLTGHVGALEAALCIPAHLTRDVNLPPFGDHTVTVARRPRPAFREQNLKLSETHVLFASLRSSRPTINFWTSVAPS